MALAMSLATEGFSAMISFLPGPVSVDAARETRAGFAAEGSLTAFATLAARFATFLGGKGCFISEGTDFFLVATKGFSAGDRVEKRGMIRARWGDWQGRDRAFRPNLSELSHGQRTKCSVPREGEGLDLTRLFWIGEPVICVENRPYGSVHLVCFAIRQQLIQNQGIDIAAARP